MKHLLTKLRSVILVFAAIASASIAGFSQTATNGYAGGDISYRLITADTIEVTLNYYVDCGNSQPATSPFIILRNCSGNPISGESMGTATVTEISNTTQTTNCAAGSIAGRRRYQYTVNLHWPSEFGNACNFYRLTISNLSRNASNNIQNSNSQRMWLEADLYLLNDSTNSSPVFNAVGVPYVCRSSSVSFSPEVSDPDNDSLVYSLVSARGGGASAVNLTYSSGSAAAPIAGITIDPTSGLLNFTSPNDSGNYQVVIQVDEYDRTSGNQLSSTYRDFQFHVDSTCVNDGPVPAAAFSNLSNVSSTVGNDTVIIDTGQAAAFRLTFTDASGISGYSSNAVSVLGGNSTFNTTNSQISWTPGAADIGVHIVTISAEDNVTPISGKGAHTITVIVQSAAQPFLITSVVPGTQTCPNPPNGPLTVNFSGGSGPFMFAVEGNFTGATDTNSTGLFTGLAFDVYRVFAIDSSNLSDTLTPFAYTVLSNALSVNSISTLGAVSCDDACDGSLRVNHSGGVSPFDYLWDDGQTTKTATDLCGGTRIVTVTDNNGCAIVDTAALYEPPAIFGSVDSTDSASCNGAADGAAYITANGGRAASNSTGAYVIDQTEGSFEPYPYGEAINANNYTVVSLDDDEVSGNINIGFSFEFFGTSYTQFRISSNGFITLGTANNDDGCCSGETLPSSAAGSVNNLIAAFWEDLDPDDGNSGTIETYEIGSGANEVRIINFVRVPHFPSGNEVTFQIALYESSNIIQIFGDSLTTDGGQHTQGIENSAGDSAFFVAGRTNTNWSAFDDYVAFIPKDQDFNYTWSSIGTGASATNLTAGTYSVITADDDGCGDTVNFTIFEPAAIVIDTVVTQPGCPGDSTGMIVASATGGSGTFTFAWNTGATGTTINNLPAGTYTVSATDNTGCVDSLTVVLTDPTAVGVTLTPTNISCLSGNDGQVLAAGTGGNSGTFTYAWNTGSTANPLTALIAGTYTVTATDGNGCTASDSATLTEPATAVTVTADSTAESCAGASDGEAEATGAGGTGAITYAWSNGGNTQTITGLPAGTYTVTATDANGCTAEDSTVVTAPASTVSVSMVDSTDVSCNGGNDGEAEVGNAAGGTAPYTYLWNTTATSQTVTGLTAGTYTVTAEDDNGCEGTAEVTIEEPATSVDVSITLDSNASCNGFSDGGLTAVGSGGTGTIGYSWNTGPTTPVITGLAATTYTVTVTDANGCTDTASQVVSEPSAVSVSATSNPENCAGAGDGDATASGSGGTGAISYVWNTGATTPTISSLAAGTYSVTATDVNGCTDSTSVVVGTGASMTLTMSSDSVDCNGGNDGSATAVAAGGTGTITYAWNNSGSGGTINGLIAATYTVTATDANGCTAEDSVEVGEPATSVAVNVGGSNVSCFGENDGVAGASASGGTPGYTYAWSNSGTGDTITGLGAGTYVVTATDANGCTAVDSVTLSEPSLLFAFTSVVTTPTCNNTADGSIQAFGFQGTAGYTYEWSNGSTSQLVSGITGGTYTVTVTDANGCTDEEDETLSAPNAIALTSDTMGESCPGAADGEGYVIVTGGTTPYTFSWSTGSTNDTVTGLTAGNYTVTVTDSNNCEDSITVTIDAGAGVTITSISGTDPDCNAGNNGTATVVATGSGTLTYAWSNGGNTATITGLVANTYVVVVTDVNGCTATDSTTLTDPTALVATASPVLHETCATNDGQATVNTTGGTGTPTFSWNTSATSQTITGLAANTYSVTVTDANGCTDSSTVVILDTCSCTMTDATIIAVDTVQCAGETSATLTAFPTGGQAPFSYAWSTGSTNDTIFNLAAGTYSVTIQDVNGATCVASDTFTLGEPSAFVATASPALHETCATNDGQATVNFTGGVGTPTFSWNNGGTTQTITGLVANTYSVTVTNGNGCTDSSSVVILDTCSCTLTDATIIAVDTIQCAGENSATLTAFPTGGQAPFSYAWSTGSTNDTIFNLAAGTYSVTIQDVNGATCVASDTFTLGEPSAFVATASPALHETCATNDGQATVNFTGGVGTPTFSWNTGGTTQTITGLVANTYSVTVTNGNGCTDSSSVVILDTCSCNLTDATISVVTSINCAGENTGSLTAAPTGGQAPFTYMWNTTSTNDTIFGLTAGTYSVTIQDVNGATCVASDTFVLGEPNAITFSAFTAVSEISCDDACDGAGTANASGGTGTLSFMWSTGANTAAASSLCGGSYTVTVTDQNACTNTAIFALVEPPSIWAVVDSVDSTGCAGNDGEAYLSAYGGFAVPTSTAAYVVDSTEGEFESYGFGQPLNANSYEVVTLQDDALSDTIEIFDGGNFSFFGNTETHFVVCSQGFITFDASNINSGQVNGMFSAPSAIPNTGGATPQEFIAGFWTDLDPSFGTAQIETYEIGSAPNRARVVNFIDVTHFATGGNTDTNTFQIVLYENSNIIQIHSTQLRNDGGSAVQGIENQAGTIAYGLSSRNNAVFDADDDYVAFIPTTQAFNYTWSSLGSSATATNLTAGTYTVTVADPNSCADTITFDIDTGSETVDAGLSVDAGVSCTGTTNTGELSVTPSGGTSPYTQTWSTGATSSTISNLPAGTYSVIVEDNNGCVDTAEVTLSGTSSSIPSPNITTSDTTVCAGSSVLLKGTSPVSTTYSDTSTFLCTNTTGGLVTMVFTNVPATAVGNATLSVTGYGDLASFIEIVNVFDENSNSMGTFDVTTSDCDTGNTNYSISQSNINSWAANNVVTFVFDANFFVTANTCSGSAFCVQGVLSFPTPQDTAYWFDDPLNLDPGLAIAFGDTTTVTATTSTSFYYANYNGVCWSDPDTVDVNVSPALNLAINTTTPISCSGDSATFTANGSGGSGTLTYQWNDGSTNQTRTMPAGTYTVTVTDSVGCTLVDSVVLTNPAAIVANGVNGFESCAQNDGVVSVNVTNGVGTIIYAWSNGGNTQTITGLDSGTYEVTVTDANGCTDSTSAIVVDTCCPVIATITQVDTAFCSGDSAMLVASAGTGTYQFNWSNGAGDTGTTDTIFVTSTTSFSVTISDGTCSDADTISVFAPNFITVVLDSVAPSCNGDNDGIAFAIVTNGSGTVNYSWSGSASTNDSLFNLVAGTYTVTVSDNNSCTATDSITILEPDPLVLTLADTAVSCNGGNDGKSCATVSGGTPNYSFSWVTGATGMCVTGLVAGTYTVTVTDANGCTETEVANITQPTLLVVTIDSTDSNDCFGAADGIAYASASGGTTNYSYAWPNGSTADTAMGLTAGTYEITVTDANGCVENATATITQPATGMTVSITNTDSAICNGSNDGAATALAANATGTVTYLWSNGDNTATTTSGLTAGTYGVTATDGTGCTASTTATIFEPIAVTVSIAFTNPSCNGFSDGSLTATGTSSVAILGYAWNTGGSAATANGLTAGCYTVTVTDVNNCTATETHCLTEPTGISATFSNIVESSCTSCTGEATVSATGIATLTYSWPNGQTGTSATLLCDGLNQVTITDGNGCVDSFAVAIPADSADTVIAFGTDPLCNGGSDGTVFTTNTCTGCTFVWTDSATTNTVGTTDTVTGLPSGTYYVEMTNTGGCTSIDTVTLSDPPGITVNIAGSTDVNCLGGNDGTASATASGGTGTLTFSWSNGAAGANVTGLTSGTYTVYATDNNGCSDSNSVFIDQPTTGLTVVATVDSNVTCNGGSNGGASATAAGGTGTITYTWNGTLNGTPVTNLTAGTYTVVVSDAGSCTASDTIEITEPSAIVITLDSTNDPTCAGDTDGAVAVTATGGTGTITYEWSTTATTQSISNLSAGVYCVTVTDANGCQENMCYTITDPTGMSNNFTGISNSSCTVCDGTATLNITGGNGTNFTYIWANGQDSVTADSLCAGVNSVTITDSLGCTLIDAVPINNDGADTVFADSIDGTCGNCDGIAYATYNCNNGPCTLEWTAFGSTTVIGTTDTLDSLCAGTYYASLTNNQGCTSVDEVEVIIPDPIDPNGTPSDESCPGAGDGSITLSPTGGSGTYNYTWSNGAGNVSTNSGLAAGTYTVTIADNDACDTIVEFIIDVPVSIVINGTTTNASCFGECDGTITLNPSGGGGSYTYNWSPIPGNGQGVQAATGLCADEYLVTVTDINGCSAFDTIDIFEPTEILQAFVQVDSATCGECDGAIDQIITGGAGNYLYAWSNGATSDTLDSICFGFYDVTVTDDSGCVAVFGYPVSETGGPSITLAGTNTSAAGQCDGEATATVVNSQGTVTYVWSNGDTTATADTLCAGTYIVTSTDINGCSSVDTITIYEPDAMLLTFTVSEITCENGPCDGEITANVTGGVTPYTYAWSNAGSGATISNLCVGTYVVTVTDVNGTFVVDSVTLDNPSSFTIASTVTEISCPNMCDGAITLNITGTGVPTILWNTGDTVTTIDSLCAGTYTVTISDTSGCDDSLTFILTSPPDITVTVDSMTEPDCQVANGSISVTGGGGTGSTYSYLWLDFEMNLLIPTQTTSTAINLFAGIYNVEVTDSNGCSDTFNIILNNNNAPDINLDSIVNVSCYGECDGSISITLSGGTSPYVTQWSSGGTMEDDSNLCAGPDTVAVADANLCLSFEIFEVIEPNELSLASFNITDVICGIDCDGVIDPIVHGGSKPYTYAWSNGSTDTAATDLCAGLYDVTITDANGCTVSSSATVGGPTALVLSVDSTNDATCEYTGDGNVFITVTGGAPGYTYSWTDANTTTFTAQDLTNVLAGTYILNVTDANGCVVSDTFVIGALNYISVSVGEDFEVCPESRDVSIIGTDSLATSVRWIDDLGIVRGSSSTLLVDISDDTNMFVFEGTNGVCVDRDTIFVYESDGPGIDAGANRSIEPGEEVTIGGDPTAGNGVNVVWTPNTDISGTTVFNPVVNPLTTTVYYVSGTDLDDCYGIDSVIITVEKIVDPVGGFSPNGDGVNDLFYIERISKYPDAVVQIYNRWGNLLYTSNKGYTNPWNGKYNGNDLTVGTYYYFIDLNVDGVDIITGPVSILK